MLSTRSKQNGRRDKVPWTKGWIGLVSIAMVTAGVTAGTASAEDHYGYDRQDRRTTLADSPLGTAAFVATLGAGLLLATHFDGDDRHVRVGHRHRHHGHRYKRHHRRHHAKHHYRKHHRYGHHARFDRGHRHHRGCGHRADVWRAPRHRDGHGRYDHDLSHRRDRRDRNDRYDRRDRRDDDRDDRRRRRDRDRW